MSNILLLTGDTSHGSATAAKSYLEGLGHVVTFSTNFATSPSGYDLVAVVRPLNTNYISDGANAKTLYQSGVPLLFGLMQGGLSTTGSIVSHYLTAAGLLGAMEQVGSSASEFKIVNNTHPITDGYSVNQLIQPASSPTWGSGLDETGASSYAGDRLGVNSASDRGNFFAVDVGSTSLDSTIVASRVVIADWFYPSSYSGAAAELFTKSIDWLLSSEAGGYPLGQLWPLTRILPIYAP